MLKGYITSENFEQGPFKLPPKLFAFDLSQFFNLGTAVDNALDKKHWQVRPNPFGESLDIESLSGTRYADIFLYDPFGKLVFAAFHESGIKKNTEQLAPGMYYLQIQEGHRIATYKLVKL